MVPSDGLKDVLNTEPCCLGLAVFSEENGENPSIKSSRTLSKALSFESKTTSKLVFSPVDISSSTGKESSYDIVSAPSPPPSREIPQQVIIAIHYFFGVLIIYLKLFIRLNEDEVDVVGEEVAQERMPYRLVLVNLQPRNADGRPVTHQKLNQRHPQHPKESRIPHQN
jgi:hypothetical protein